MDGPALNPGKQIGLKEVMARLGVSESTVRRLVEAGRLSPPRRSGKRPYWWEIDLLIYQWRCARGDFDGQEAIEDPPPKDPDYDAP